jgi:hypothetical protein
VTSNDVTVDLRLPRVAFLDVVFTSDPVPDRPVGYQPRRRHSNKCNGRVATEWCYHNLHCMGCGMVVPTRGYVGCGECGHVYRTRWHLLYAYWGVFLPIWWHDWRHPMFPGFRSRWYDVFRGRLRPSRIYFCQCCLHDL